MPAVFALLKSPAILKWGAILALITGLFVWGTYNSNQADSYKKDVVLSEVQVGKLQTALLFERSKAKQRELDAVEKQKLIDGLSQDKLALYNEYTELQSELDDLVNNIIPNIKTDADLVEVKQVVEQAVNLSFGCIEAATKGDECVN